jgi:glycosyltransferase involved in cell wall biosynthesis
MCGWVDFDRLGDYFAAADTAVYPFDDILVNRAKCPAKLTELMVNECPVVAEGVGQIREYILHGESGLICPPGDTTEFASMVETVLRDESLNDQLSAAARKRILSEFEWAELAKEVEESYRKAINPEK